MALVGNPNTGKTTLFNALAGMRQHVGNYPGVTVETKKGRMTHQGRSFELVDLPGTYSLAPRSPDEMVAVDLVLGQQPGEPRPDVVVAIVDAANLERNLYLATQAMELGVPVVVALNMIDVAERHGIRIDAERLAKQLGVPVVPIQANKGRGLDRLKQTIADCGLRVADCPDKASVPEGVRFPKPFEREVRELSERLGEQVPRFLVRRLLLDVGGYTEKRLAAKGFQSAIPNPQSAIAEARQRLAAAGCPVPAVEARARYGWIREATAGCVQRPSRRPVSWTDRLDRVLTHKLWGTLVFLALMFVVFQAIFTWAEPLMDLIDRGKDGLAGALGELLPRGPLASLLIGGVLEGVGSVVIFLPQILILFAFIAVLEDCGYMARAAFLMDKLMARCGLSGKSFIPMLSSVACAVPGVMAARVIENRRDRLATILVAPLMSCSARLPVYILLIGAFLTEGHAFWVPGLTMFAMYAIGLVAAPLVALALKRTLLRGETPVFVMEMPLYKWPSPGTVLRRMTDSGTAFLRRAGTIILASMVVVWALLYFPRTEPQPQAVRLTDPETGVVEEQRVTAYDEHATLLEGHLEKLLQKAKAAEGGEKERLQTEADDFEEQLRRVKGDWQRQSVLGRMGRAIEPAVRPLGWDWKIGMAALASFPAREVVVGTLGIIYNQGDVDPDEASTSGLPEALRQARWDDDPAALPVFTVPVALSLMVFFALCCQCASTLAVIRRETNSWRWPLFTFTYMTVLAYLGALVVYQVGSWF